MGDSLEEIIQVVNKVDERGRQIASLSEHHRRAPIRPCRASKEINAVSVEYAASTEEVSASTEELSASYRPSRGPQRAQPHRPRPQGHVEKFKV
jgi:methyl-accepting chemotaxis protein